MTDPLNFEYRAFLSYSHADTTLAEWIHDRLENFSLQELAGHQTPLGPVPTSLRPIFRDREDFTAGGSLKSETIAALDASAALIVLCSPASARSYYVNEEIRLYKHRDPSRRIVPVILAGAPNNPARECFPPALKFEVDAEGNVTRQLADMPIAADVRKEGDGGDGRELALAKVAAALIGVPSDDVFQRAERERKHRMRVRVAIGAIVVMLASVGGYFGWGYYINKTFVDDLAPGRGEDVTATRRDELKAHILLETGKTQKAEDLLRSAVEEKKAFLAAARKQTAEDYRALGAIARQRNTARALDYYSEAVTIDPADRESLYWVGTLNLFTGNVAAAEEALSTLLNEAAFAGDDKALYRAQMRLGEIDLKRGNLTGALEREKLALIIAERCAQAAPGDAECQGYLSDAYIKVGDVLEVQGNHPAALAAYRNSLTNAQRLVERDPGNRDWRIDVDFAYRDGFQMAVGWMRADFARPDRRLKAPEEGNRGQQGYAMEIKREGSGVVWRLRCVLLRRQGRCWR